MTATRIERRFAALKSANRGGLVTFITAGDPNYELSLDLVRQLPAAGADVIELGMPFTDPMADGPAIQASSLRALRTGMTLKRSLQLVTEFRKGDNETPIILMGYYNPISSSSSSGGRSTTIRPSTPAAFASLRKAGTP